MSKKSSAERRAEARRRSRLQAQGQAIEEEQHDEMAATGAPTPNFFQRIFPPAAPLPGKPPPLTGFSHEGGLRWLALAWWLTRRNLYAGVGMGVLWAAAYVVTVQEAGSIFGTVASFVSFGSLVAAGWFGWQRPWFYGFLAAVLGYLLYVAYVVAVLSGNPGIAEAQVTSTIAAYLATNGLLQAGIGALAGFYGGYLRRRLAESAGRQAADARRRR
jgi:hypothetical protein